MVIGYPPVWTLSILQYGRCLFFSMGTVRGAKIARVSNMLIATPSRDYTADSRGRRCNANVLFELWLAVDQVFSFHFLFLSHRSLIRVTQSFVFNWIGELFFTALRESSCHFFEVFRHE